MPAPAVRSSNPSIVQAATAGIVSFTVDGSAQQFDALPDGHNYYTQLASQITARPSIDAAEQLSITFASIDLRQVEFPAELPGPRLAGTRLDPLAAMAGPGRVRIDRYGRDGVIVGSFTDVSLPHTEKRLPNITLTAGSFRARISAPW